MMMMIYKSRVASPDELFKATQPPNDLCTLAKEKILVHARIVFLKPAAG